MRFDPSSGLAFSTWLPRQASRRDAVGALARGAKRDREFRPTTHVSDLRARLRQLDAGPAARDALDEAEREWGKAASRSSGTADKREPDPRIALLTAARARRTPLAGLSRMLERPPGYLARFVREGVPIALTRREHSILADFFGVDERGMGIRDLWADRERTA